MEDIDKYFRNITQKKYNYFSKNRRINSIKYKYEKYLYKNKNKLKIHKIGSTKTHKIASIIFNIIGLLLFITSYYFYYLSLEKCFDGEDTCSKKLNWIIQKIKQLIISSAIIIFLMILIIYGKLSKLHIFHFVITFINFYYYSHLSFFVDHGIFNLIGLFGSLIFSFILLLIIKIIITIFKFKYRYKIILFIALMAFYNFLINPTNCDDWPKGLNNTYIENDINKYGCQIIFPKKCDYKVLSFTQDLSKLYHYSCSNKDKNSRKNILKFSRSPYINEKTLKFGFPLTNNDEGQKDGRDDIILKRYTSKNLIDMDKNIPPQLSNPEIIVDFSKDPFGEMIIKLNYNETLCIERKKFERNSDPYSDNILVLYIDSISRNNALRKLKKTIKFFEKFISYKGGSNQNYQNENFHSFQFFKYHAFNDFTGGNFPQIFYGKGNKSKNMVRITKYLKENGYVTGFAIDFCQKDNTRVCYSLSKEELYDHQFTLCDPNKANLNSLIKRCLYGNLGSYYLYEYINQFWRKYQNNRKFSTIVINDGHEGTLEAIKYTDDIIYNFLNNLFNDNLLKSTSIFLMSDHGSAMASIYYLSDFYQIEFRLPMLFIIINDRKNVDYNHQYYNIHKNQQTFITGFDIYNTMCHIIYGDNYINIPNKDSLRDTPKSPQGKSLFEEINQKERHPQNYWNMDNRFCI